MIPLPVFLMGYMGSGKTTLGRALSKDLGIRFIDLDEEIERETGLGIPEIFKTRGETSFRSLETSILRTIDLSTPVIVALGGGTPCHSDNVFWINQHGLSVYVRVPIDKLIHRLRSEKANRPLLAGLAEGELEPFIREQIKARETYYLKAYIMYIEGLHKMEELKEWVKEDWR